MMRTKYFRTVAEVVAWRMCMGCGACDYACPNKAILLVDIYDDGIRPQVDENKCQKCGECIKICPGIGLEHEPFPEDSIEELKQSWGPILQLWEGFAVDHQTRYAGSSGGVATALALYAMENGIVGGVLHVGVDKDNPIKNVPVYSRTREELLACSGSRYAPAAPCQAFDIIKKEAGKSIFIGKPCDVAALRKACKFDTELDKKVAFTISIFCAGTPTTKGTSEVLEQMGVRNVAELKSFRYRGNGWPGFTTAIEKQGKVHKMPYSQSWGDILTKHGQLRCRLCADGTGEFADISCGDPWYRKIEPDDAGRSVVIVRTLCGLDVLHRAMDAGYVELERVSSTVLPASQKSIFKKRQMIFGRFASMRMMFIPVSKFKGFSLFSNWRQLSVRDKCCSIFGTIRRIICRGWFKPAKPLIIAEETDAKP